MKYPLLIPVFIVSFFLHSCKNTEVTAPEEEVPVEITLNAEQQSGAGIIISKPEVQILSSRLACNGRIETPPYSRAKVSSLLNGYVKKIDIYDGKFIRKGEVIALLEHPDFLQLQHDYLLEKSRYRYLSLDYDRQSKLNDQNINSEKELQRVRSEWEQSGITLNYLASMLAMLGVEAEKLNDSSISSLFAIKAPIDGYAEGISIALGQFVNPEEIIVELVNRNEFLIVLQVFEKDIARVEAGQRVTFICPNPESQVTYHYGKIIYSGQKIDETSRTFQVYASPDEDYANMRHGMMIRADIGISGVSSLTVPVEAIVYSDNGEYVFIREGEKFRPVRVETGISDRGFIEIVNSGDLENRDIVIAGGVYLMAEMQKE